MTMHYVFFVLLLFNIFQLTNIKICYDINGLCYNYIKVMFKIFQFKYIYIYIYI